MKSKCLEVGKNITNYGMVIKGKLNKSFPMSELLLHHIYIKSTASPRKGHGEPAQDELNRTQKTKEQQRKASVGLFSSLQLLSRV